MKTHVQRILLVYIINLFAISGVSAQSTPSSASHGWAPGFHLSEVSNDFGLGLNLISPSFANGWVAVHLHYDYQWLEHLNNGGTETWTGYHRFRLGLLTKGSQYGNIRLYSEGGTQLALLPGSLSDNNIGFGGYGLFGFEFGADDAAPRYYIELGGVGSGITANQLPSNPSMANGFMINVGIRWMKYK